MARSSTWGDNLTLQAIADAYNIEAPPLYASAAHTRMMQLLSVSH